MFKILCTGNPEKNTLAKYVRQVMPDAEFVYLSAGYDLTTQEGLDKFRTKIKDYNVFINASRIKPGVQVELLKIVHEELTDCHVFNIGSVLEYDFWSWFKPEDTNDKRLLKKLSLEFCNQQFKTTHITTGAFQDQKPDAHLKMDPLHIVNAIKWIMEAEGFYIPVLGIENDYTQISDWNEKKQYGIKLCNS